MLAVRQAAVFRRDIRRLVRRGADLAKLEKVVALLAAQKPLEPDWVLIYRVEGNDLQLARTGSHADLFE